MEALASTGRIGSLLAQGLRTSNCDGDAGDRDKGNRRKGSSGMEEAVGGQQHRACLGKFQAGGRKIIW